MWIAQNGIAGLSGRMISMGHASSRRPRLAVFRVAMKVSGLCCERQVLPKTYYRITADATVSTNNISLSKSVVAAYTNLWSRSRVIADGAILRVEAQGTTVRVYLNGSQLGADATDGSIGAGDPGVFYSSQSDPVRSR